ncbi:hypothetical protein ACAN107058_19080 [Paracidovorax anthurii]
MVHGIRIRPAQQGFVLPGCAIGELDAPHSADRRVLIKGLHGDGILRTAQGHLQGIPVSPQHHVLRRDARLEPQRLAALAAHATRPRFDDVAPIAPAEQIDIAAHQHVVARAAVQRVAPGMAHEAVVARAALQFVLVLARGPERRGGADGRILVFHHVVAIAALHDVILHRAAHNVVAGIADQVHTLRRIDSAQFAVGREVLHVRVVIQAEDLPAGAPRRLAHRHHVEDDPVRASARRLHHHIVKPYVVGVVTALAGEHVARRVPGRPDLVGLVVARGAQDLVAQQFDVLDVGDPRQVHGDAGGNDRVVDRDLISVGIDARLDHLVARAVHHVEVVFRAADQRVVAADAIQHEAAEPSGTIPHQRGVDTTLVGGVNDVVQGVARQPHPGVVGPGVVQPIGRLETKV